MTDQRRDSLGLDAHGHPHRRRSGRDDEDRLGQGWLRTGIGFGHAKVGGYNVWLLGYHPLVATLSTPLSAPVVAATRLRSGNTGSSKGAASMIAETIGTARACGATGEIVVRADSAFYAKTVISTCRRHQVRFSVTTRIDTKIRAACDGIVEDQWTCIRYPQAVWDEDAGRWISDAQIAETADEPHTARRRS